MSRYLFCCCHIVFSSPRPFIWVVDRLPTMFNFRDILYLRLRAKNAHFQTFWRQNGAIMSRYELFHSFITIYWSIPFIWVVDQLLVFCTFWANWLRNLCAENGHFQTFWRQNGAIMSRYEFFCCFITIYSSKPFVWVVDQLPVFCSFWANWLRNLVSIYIYPY